MRLRFFGSMSQVKGVFALCRCTCNLHIIILLSLENYSRNKVVGAILLNYELLASLIQGSQICSFLVSCRIRLIYLLL